VIIILKKIDLVIEKICGYLLVTSVFLMLLLTLLNIVLRWFQLTINWIDPMVRHLVFFSAFLGGTYAVGKRKHISIDLLGLFFEAKGNKKVVKALRVLTDLAVIVILFWLLLAGIEFIKVEKEFGKVVMLGIHSSWLVGIMPFGFVLMLIRTCILFLETLFSSELIEKNTIAKIETAIDLGSKE
jgi:TRAP-type C4-dicarboxylate transport system permease small subunit